MSEHLRDPELDRLIHELNRRPGRPGGSEGAAGGERGALGESEESGLESGSEAGPVELFVPVEEASAVAARPRPMGGGAAGGADGGRVQRAGAGGAARGGRRLAGADLSFDAEAPARVEVEAGSALGRLLADVLRRGASDLLLLPGMPPVFRIDGRLRRGEAGALSGEGIARLFEAQLGGRAEREMEERGSADFSLHLQGAERSGRAESLEDAVWAEGADGPSGRFRVNLHRQGGQLAASLRALPREVPSLGSLNLPLGLAELVKPSRGLILVCGPTGSGKSSTLAALIGEINRTRTEHVITIEDPVEYEHRSNRSLIEHVEIGRDARTFSEALRAALRQDPDVILVGEMRDLDTVATAVTAAETGHLVLATLHSNDAVQAVHRIVDVFPPVQQMQIRQQLALSLHAVIAQQLVPRADGRGRIPAIELMLASFPVRSHIRNDQLQKLYNEITIGRRIGMTSFEESLAVLVREGKIDLDEARVRATHPEEFDARLRG